MVVLFTTTSLLPLRSEWMNKWMNGGWLRSHESPPHDMAHRCMYRRMGPRIKEVGSRPAQILADLSKSTFEAPSSPCLWEKGKCAVSMVEAMWGEDGPSDHKSSGCRTLSRSAWRRAHLGPGHGLYTLMGSQKQKAQMWFVSFQRIKTELRGGWGGVRESIRRQIPVEKEQFF